MKDKELIEECRKHVECDTARICKLSTTMFLIVGFNRNTKQDEGEWIRNGEKVDFDYVNETTIASGTTPEELIENTKYYSSLKNRILKDYFVDQIEDSIKLKVI